jgi:hypothetical protein
MQKKSRKLSPPPGAERVFRPLKLTHDCDALRQTVRIATACDDVKYERGCIVHTPKTVSCRSIARPPSVEMRISTSRNVRNKTIPIVTPTMIVRTVLL